MTSELLTDRLLLRMFTQKDLDDLAVIYADPEVMKFVGHGVRTREETQAGLIAMLNHWMQHGFGMWAVVDKAHGQLIGRCGLCYLDSTPEVEVGYVFARPYWGLGLATEAARASLKYGFEALELPRIVGITRPENIASQRVLQKIGLHYEREAHFYNRDVKYFAIDRVDWQGASGQWSVVGGQ